MRTWKRNGWVIAGDSNDTPNVADSVQNEPMECSDDDDEPSTTLEQLKVIGQPEQFIIHNIPYDGDCMFSAISYQLQTNGVCSDDSSELRQKVADHLEANIPLYLDFLCQPVTYCSYTADTEHTTPKDEIINSVVDPQLQFELRWQKYVDVLDWEPGVTT